MPVLPQLARRLAAVLALRQQRPRPPRRLLPRPPQRLVHLLLPVVPLLVTTLLPAVLLVETPSHR